MSTKKEHKITVILVVIILCMPFCLGIAYKYRSELNLEKRFIQIKSAVLSRNRIVAKIDFFAKVNGKDMRIIFEIPCKNMKTKQVILDNMTRIKHEMLMSMESDLNKMSIEKRDFRRIKSNCVEILNKYTPVDVNKVYVNFFAHN